MTASDFDLFTTILLPSSKFRVFGRHKALLLCKSPCEGTASVTERLRSPPQAPAKRNFQRKFALRRFKTRHLPLGNRIVRKRSKPVLPKNKNESAQIFVSTPDLFCTANLDPQGISNGPRPFCLMRVSAVQKRNFFLAARHHSSLRS